MLNDVDWTAVDEQLASRGTVNEWTTEDGDIVLMCGGGWPEQRSLCPMHEAESPPSGERVTLTLRDNKGGYGADYFATASKVS